MKKVTYIFGIMLLSSLFSCEDLLEEKVYSQLATDNYLATKSGVESVLYQVYDLMQRNGHDFTIQLHYDLIMTGRGDGKLGAWEGSTASVYRSWSWLPTQWDIVANWNTNYKVIYYCNTVLDNIENESFSEEFRERMRGEALALRGHAYYLLFDHYGGVVITTTSETSELNRARSSEAETMAQIESDLLEASTLLPIDQELYGEITKGGALGMLCKFYLNTKQWQKCADVAQAIINLNKYDLFPDFTTLFHIKNEGNEEVIWVQPQANLPGNSNTLSGLTLPGNWPFTGTQATFPAVIYVPDWFVDSYLPGDTRAEVIVKQYTAANGSLVVGYGKNRSIPFKYGPDPDADGGNASNDYIELRYADILLARAEALNELDGPNQESIELINRIRNRAGDIPELTLEEASSQSVLRDIILQERNREFHFENKTRQDLIRHGKLISDAQARGITHAADYHRLFPIPQTEIDANPNIEQNPGY